MCGIAGACEPGASRDASQLDAIARAMADRLRHRGPDDAGTWVDARSGIALGHRRLSIVDLSPQGHQPMVSACGRYVVAFNGEIYNFEDLRRALAQAGAAPAWRGHSDTEVLLAAIAHWGLEDTLVRLTGMFAFALWDRVDGSLSLARDRLGEKPLYYGWQGRALLFGSELKALRAHPAWVGGVDRNALLAQMRYSYVPAPYCIHPGIAKLPAGGWIRYSADDLRTARTPAVSRYWSLAQVVERGIADPWTGGEDGAVDALDGMLKAAVARQMVADVPVGAFLSGGIDSSTIVSFMQAQSSRPVRTFTIGFHEREFDESVYAREVARHLGTDHTELRVSPSDALDAIPRLAGIYDEPYSDASQIPTLLVSELTRRHVTVSLSGDGGDELFGGYNRYFWCRQVWNRLRRLPKPARSAAARLLTAVPPEVWNRLFALAGPAVPKRLRYANPGDKLHKLAGVLGAAGPVDLYRGFAQHWIDTDIVPGAVEPPTELSRAHDWVRKLDLESMMMYVDAVTYLPDDILVKVDRASMAASLESRVPFLDHHVVEFAWRLPLALKMRNGTGKWILRRVLDRYVPRELIDRPKMGFGVPIEDWLRGPLRDWAETLLAERVLARDGLFDVAAVRRKWAEHSSGRRNWQYYLWDVLMFQAWRQENPT
jgi:asparagine synthase (glutamine-hydrolysing)